VTPQPRGARESAARPGDGSGEIEERRRRDASRESVFDHRIVNDDLSGSGELEEIVRGAGRQVPFPPVTILVDELLRTSIPAMRW
jgi:hypothetical protein